MDERQNIKRFFCLAIIVLSFQLAKAQFPRADSLIRLLDKEKNKTARIDLLNRIAYAYYDHDDSAALAYAMRALNEARSQRYTKGLKSALTLVGIGHYSAGRYNQALSYLRESDRLVDQALANEMAYNAMSQYLPEHCAL